MSYPTVSDDPAVQAFYEAMRAEGTAHTLAEMFALRRGPTLRTDSTFLEGTANGRQFEKRPDVGDLYKKRAAAAGVSVKGRVYKSSLAAFPGDPRAWVSGRGDVQKVCEERGWGCEGAVGVKAREPALAPTAGPALAADVVRGLAEKAVAADPGLAERPAAEVVEKVVAKHKPHWAQ